MCIRDRPATVVTLQGVEVSCLAMYSSLAVSSAPGASGTFVQATSQAAAFNVNTGGATFAGTLTNTGALTDIDIRVDGDGLSATYKYTNSWAVDYTTALSNVGGSATDGETGSQFARTGFPIVNCTPPSGVVPLPPLRFGEFAEFAARMVVVSAAPNSISSAAPQRLAYVSETVGYSIVLSGSVATPNVIFTAEGTPAGTTPDATNVAPGRFTTTPATEATFGFDATATLTPKLALYLPGAVFAKEIQLGYRYIARSSATAGTVDTILPLPTAPTPPGGAYVYPATLLAGCAASPFKTFIAAQFFSQNAQFTAVAGPLQRATGGSVSPQTAGLIALNGDGDVEDFNYHCYFP